MANEVNLTPGESIHVNAPPGETLQVNKNEPTAVWLTATDTSVEPPPTEPPPATGEGVLIGKAELMALPTSGTAWTKMLGYSNQAISPSLSNQDSPANVQTLAAAFVAVRQNDTAKRNKVIAALKTLKSQGLDRALALGRELGAYVIASDLVKATDAEVGYDQKAFYLGIITKATSGGPSNLVNCAKQRPNNWGTHAMGAIACVYAKYGTDAQKEELYKWVKGWLGDRAAYKGFTYGDLSWQADPANPVGINPKGATKQSHNIDGVLPDDQRRAGGFTWPPPKENYVYEALQGALLAALVLERTGRSVASQQSEALYRAYRWLIDECKFTPTGDDTWEPWALRKLYPTHKANITASAGTTPGKNFGFTDWLYG